MSYTHDRQHDRARHSAPSSPGAPLSRGASSEKGAGSPQGTGGRLDEKLESAARRVAVIRGWFYAVVLLVALGGQITGAMQALKLPWYFAVPAVTALELGGVVVMANADVRRRLGERAIASRLLSAAIAGGAVAFNWLSHDDKKIGGFFAGMSLLGYLVWLMHTENSRRDRLRSTGDLPPTTPAYEPVGHWLRHPWVTRRALALAKASPGLGLYPSLRAAQAQIRAERRQAALSTVLHRKIRKALDKDTADIAVAVYDLDEIARRLADRADYDGLTALIASDLTPARVLASNHPSGAKRRGWRRAKGPDPAAVAAAQQLIAETLTALPAADARAGGGPAAVEATADQPPALPAGSDSPTTVRSGTAADQTTTAGPDDPADQTTTAGSDHPADQTTTAESHPADQRAGRQNEWDREQVQRELEVLMPAAVARDAYPENGRRGRALPNGNRIERNRDLAENDGGRRGNDLPDLVRTAVGRTSSAAALAAAPAEIPEQRVSEQPGPEQTTGSLRARVYAALDQLVPADDARDIATITDLVVEHLGLDSTAHKTARKYVRSWRTDVAAGRREPAAARRLRSVPPPR